MPLGAAAIQTYRDREMKMLYNYLQNVDLGSMKIRTETMSGVAVRIRSEPGDELHKLHDASIKSAIKDITGAGHNVPPLDFYLCADTGIPNVAMKTYDAGGGAAPTVLLGQKMWAKNPKQPGTDTIVVGGLGASGVRGVANQRYDECHRLMGSPGKNAQGASIVVHELGHVLHEINDPGVFWEEQQALEAGAASPNGNGWQGQAPDVSSYAGNNQLEFVAEVFTGQIYGRNYSATVTAMYAQLGGP